MFCEFNSIDKDITLYICMQDYGRNPDTPLIYFCKKKKVLEFSATMTKKIPLKIVQQLTRLCHKETCKNDILVLVEVWKYKTPFPILFLLHFHPSSFISTWRSHPTRPFQHLASILLLGHTLLLLLLQFTSHKLFISISTNFHRVFLILHCSVSTKIYAGLKLQSQRVHASVFLFNFISFCCFSLTNFQLQVLLECLPFHLM
jgi:hypothetical protein